MSTENKLTPLQEAITRLEKLSGKKPVIRLLKSLLPKEKEFAREMWNDGIDSVDYDITTDENDTPYVDVSYRKEFIDHYKQYEQS